MDDIKKLIGKRIQSIRKGKGFTQEKLSELVGIEPQSLSNMENGKFAPTPDTLQKLSNELNVLPYEFYLFNTISDLEMKRFINEVLDIDIKLLHTVYFICKNFEY